MAYNLAVACWTHSRQTDRTPPSFIRTGVALSFLALQSYTSASSPRHTDI
jgi:hypothetical protein